MSVEDSIKSEINSLSRDVESCHGSLVRGSVQRKKILRCYAKSCETGSLQQERKEKRALPRETTSWAVLDEHSRSKRQKDVEGAEKRQTKEGEGGYNYGSTGPSIKK